MYNFHYKAMFNECFKFFVNDKNYLIKQYKIMKLYLIQNMKTNIKLYLISSLSSK